MLALGLFLIGLPNAFLWGLLAAVFRFVPYVGPWIAAVFPIALSLAVFETWTQPLLVLGLFAVMSFASGRLYDRVGAKATVTAGTVCLAVGPFLLSLIPEDAGYASFVPGLAVTGIGVGLFHPSVTTAAVTLATTGIRGVAKSAASRSAANSSSTGRIREQWNGAPTPKRVTSTSSPAARAAAARAVSASTPATVPDTTVWVSAL